MADGQTQGWLRWYYGGTEPPERPLPAATPARVLPLAPGAAQKGRAAALWALESWGDLPRRLRPDRVPDGDRSAGP